MKFLSPVLITGASGFVGSHLAETLAKQKIKIKLLVRTTSRLPFQLLPGMELCYGDVTDLESVRTATRNVRAIYHLAGVLRGSDLSSYRKVNVAGTWNICWAAAEAGTVKRLTYISSLSAAGPSEVNSEIDETMPCRPISFYGQTKLEGEKIVQAFNGKFQVSILRPGVVYGQRETDLFEYFRMVNRGLVLNSGDGNQRVSFIHVADLVEAILLASQSLKANGRTFFVSDGQDISWNELAQLIGNVLKKTYKTFNVPLGIVRIVASLGDWAASWTGKPLLPPIVSKDKVKEAAAPGWVCSNRKIRRELSFTPRIDIRKGIVDTARFYLENGWLQP